MPIAFHKNLTEITESDIANLIANQVRENQNLEYKITMYGNGDEDKREMLRDIVSLANAQGGHILIGIREDDQGEGIPVEIIGIEDAGIASERIVSSCLSNIDERISGLQTHSIPLGKGKHLMMVQIPKSLKAPHMVTFKGLNQFWKRHDRQKSPMSTNEIKEACHRTEELMVKMEQFLERRKQAVLKEAKGKPLYYISATPYFLNEDVIDIYDEKIRNQIKNPPDHEKFAKNVECGGYVTPTLNGLISEISNFKSLEVFRNGHSEFKVYMDRQFSGFVLYNKGEVKENVILRSLSIPTYTVSFLRFYKKIFEYLNTVEPLIVCINFFNIKEYGLYRKTGEEDFGELNVWHDENLEMPPQTIFSFESPDKTAKLLTDRIWNAFKYESAPFFDSEGNFAP